MHRAFKAGAAALALILVAIAALPARAEPVKIRIGWIGAPGQLVAFVCNWRVAILTDCPDEIVRTEFDPAAFVNGVHEIVKKH